jgi:integrase
LPRKPRPIAVTLQRIEDRGLDEQRRPYWRIRGPDPETGRRTTLQTGRMTESEANHELAKEEARALLGLQRPDDSRRSWTVSQVVAAVVEELGERLGADHPHVVSETRRLAHVTAHLGSMAADRVTTAHLERYAALRRRDPCRTGEPVARRSLTEEIAAWQRAVRTLRDLHRVDFDPPPMPALKSIPDDSRPQRRLTEAELAAILRAAEAEGGVELWSLLTVLAWSGRRPVAVFAATHGDCRRVLDDALPRVERLMFWAVDKGGVGRGWGPLTDPAYHAIRAIADADQLSTEPLWRTGYDNEWTAVRMARVLERVTERAGVEGVQLYDLRRRAITRILDGVGGLVARAQRYTGHRTVQSLLRYVYAEQGEAESAAPSIGWSAPQLAAVEEES